MLILFQSKTEDVLISVLQSKSYEQVEVMIVYLKLSTYFTEWHISEECIQYYYFEISKLLFPNLKPESFWIKREYL